jgi:hypothetical protein
MVDQESKTYRPRRALIEPDDEPAQPKRPAPNGHNGNGSVGRPRVVDEDQPKPLYRDDGWPNGWSHPALRATPIPAADPPTEETVMTPATLAPRRSPSLDDETTTILPRSRPTKHLPQALDAIDDYDDYEPTSLSRRTKLALLIGSVAVVVVIGIVIGYVVTGGQPQNQPSLSPSAGTNATSTSGGKSQDPTGTTLLTDASMLNPGQAKDLDPKRTWKVASTPGGANEDAPHAACFGDNQVAGQPAPQQKIVRELTSSGKKAPTALHEATAYNSPEEASQAYVIASKTIGGCAVAGFYIESGHIVSGAGSQAAGVVVMEVQGKKRQAHSVVLNRSGRVMNLVDVVQPSKAVAIAAVADVLGQVNGAQCRAAGGECGGNSTVKDGPPPLGGDEPAFLTTGDLPPAGAKVEPWVATQVEPPKAEFQGSQCEGVRNWAIVSAESRSARVYLPQESGKDFFGLNEIVLTMKDAKAARKQVEKIKSSIWNCRANRLTAKVTERTKVTGIGTQKTKVRGWTAVVSQTSTQGVAKYRVGIVSARDKVVYTFLNPNSNQDFTNHQWNTVAVRAGERSTWVD